MFKGRYKFLFLFIFVFLLFSSLSFCFAVDDMGDDSCFLLSGADGLADSYWDYHHPSENPDLIPSYVDMVQVKKKNKNSDSNNILRPYDRAPGYGFGISNLFVSANMVLMMIMVQ